VSQIVADYVLARLTEWGVHRVYGYPGDGINAFLGAFDRAGGDPDFIQVRHEEMAAFMACGHAKFTGEVGVCIATSGPGAIHLMNGLYDAKLDHQPVVAIVGQQALSSLGGHYQQEVDLQTLFKDVAHEYVQMAADPAQVRHLVDRAVRIALDQRTVTCIIVPNDVASEEAVEAPPHEHGTIHSGIGYSAPKVVPAEGDLERAATVLNESEKVAMLIGQGAMHAADEVVEVAETLGAGVAKALLGKAALPDDLPFVTGAIGLLGTKPSWDLMQGCDALLMVGSSFPYSEFLPEEGKARGVQIDIDGRMVGIRYPMEVNLVGDAKETLNALLPKLERKEDRSWRDEIEEGVRDWWELMESRAMADADPLNPQRVFWELSERLPDGAILTADSGSSANWYARDIKFRKGMMGSLSGTLATMGPGVPYAIAAKFAHPNRPVIALIGDGAFQMNGMNELITVAKYRERWPDQRFIVLVLNNRDLNQVTWEQRAQEGDPKYEGSQVLPDFPYARYGELLGFEGIRVDDPDSVGAAWDEALGADRPVVLEAVTDPEVPPLPPHITFMRARVEAPVERVDVSAFTVPTDEPESDGTFEWQSTTIVAVEVRGGGKSGLGYTYAPAAAGQLVEEKLAEVVEGRDALAISEAWEAIGVALRNVGRPGIGFCALSAIDLALWDLKARLLELPLVDLVGRARDEVPVYGSGGFTSYSLETLREQLSGWVDDGIPRVKIKVSRDPDRDPERLEAARQAIGDDTGLYVDSNGALQRKDRAPAGLDIAAGEYAYVPADFRNLLVNGCVDCLQADVTRCGGITGLLRAAGLADAFGVEISGHCAPQLSAHALCAVPNLRHLEYFHDHVRIESLLFDGVLDPVGGALRPDRSRPGHGLELKRADAEEYAA
jgi:pyruvate dehydrogenase (quinone)